MTIIIKTRDDIQAMRDSAKINNDVHNAVCEAIKPGVTTKELDEIAYEIIIKAGGTPAFLGYPPGGRNPFPATLTISVNEELVHGIPGKRVLKDGDIVSIDCGTVYNGFVSDSAYTYGVGKISPEAARLLEVTEQSLYVGIEQCVSGNRFGDVSAAIQAFVEKHGYNVVREYGGHGVGREMHEAPHIPNWGKPNRGPQLKSGMTFAIEPMVMVGSPETQVLTDNWTVITADKKLCAHYEHTIAVTDNGPFILTKWD